MFKIIDSRIAVSIFICVTASLLSACFGGSSSGDRASSSSSINYQPNAAAAKVSAVVNLTANTTALNWTDSFPSGTSYQIKSQNADGSFTTIETISGLGGSGGAISWKRPATISTTYRIEAVTSGQTTTLITIGGQLTVIAEVPVTPPSILSDKAEPASGTVRLSLDSIAPYFLVEWFSDQALIGSGASSAGNPINWSTAAVSSGVHEIMAKIQISVDSYIEITRPITVFSTNLVGSILNENLDFAGQAVTSVFIRASSINGIASVSATLDGTSLGALTTPNSCYKSNCTTGTTDGYRFNINNAAFGSGSHNFVATVTDNSGGTVGLTKTIAISNAPLLTVNSPQFGTFVRGTVNLSGSFSTDKPVPVTLVVALGSTELLRTTASPFAKVADISGFAPGDYTLSIRADDGAVQTVIQNTLTVATSDALKYQPLFSIGPNGGLLAAEADKVLYAAADGSKRLKNIQNNQEITLTNAALVANARNWQISGGKVFALGVGPDCPSPRVCVYMWQPNGAMTNISVASPYASDSNPPYDNAPVAKDGYVIWANHINFYTVYNVNTGSYTKINPPSGALYIGNIDYDFYVTEGVIQFYFWASTGGSRFDIFKWSSDTQAVVKLTNGTMRSIYPKTDGNRTAWLESDPSTPVAVGPSTLLTQNVSGGSISTVSSGASANFLLQDQVLSWVEKSATSNLLKASYNGSTSVISNLLTAFQYGSFDRKIIFGELGKVYVWNAVTGQKSLLIDTYPSQSVVASGAIYFVMGANRDVYRVPLN